MDDNIIKAYRDLLETSKKNPILGAVLPFSKSEIKIAEKALNQYQEDCRKCALFAKNDINCLETARTNFNRNMPSSYKDVYPWKNYDWNYANYISNNYSTDALKPGGGNLKGIIKNATNISKSLDGFIFDPIPNNLSNPYGFDINSDYPVYKCKDDQLCRITESIKRNRQEIPTTDKFIKQFPIDGEYSSSYFYRLGSCRRPDIKNMNDCEKRGYKWTPSSIEDGGGSCIQPKYMYIDNSPKPFFNGSKGKGLIPSITNDLLDIMPDKLFNNLLGQSTSGLQIDVCPNVEAFENVSNYNKIGIVILIGLIIIYIGNKLK